MHVRCATASEIPHLATLWFDAWQETHKPLSPPELIRLRTLESFTERLAALTEDTRVVDLDGEPAGFSVIKGDELYQLFLAPAARGSRVAAALIADAEARLAARGVEVAWLTCAIGNHRAARFYEKCGWRNVGAVRSRCHVRRQIPTRGLALREDAAPRPASRDRRHGGAHTAAKGP